MSLPPEVIARCAATTGTYGGCHGATSIGLRWPDRWYQNEAGEVVRIDSLAESLIELAEDMHERYAAWSAREADQTERRRWDRARQIAAYIAKEGL